MTSQITHTTATFTLNINKMHMKTNWQLKISPWTNQNEWNLWNVLLQVYDSLGPVVQSIVNLTSSLRGQQFKCFTTLLPNILIFFVQENVRSFCNVKPFHILSIKNIGIFQLLMFEILMKHQLMMLLVLNNWALMFFCHFVTSCLHPMRIEPFFLNNSAPDKKV